MLHRHDRTGGAKIRAMETAPARRSAPTDEDLLDVRTPAELASSPDGAQSRSRCTPRWPTSDRSCRAISTWSRPTAASRGSSPRGVERPHAGLVARRFAAGVPLGSDHARSSAAVHDGRRRRRTRARGDARPARPRAWRGRATARRLLVLVADPGCYGLDWSARAVDRRRSGGRSARPAARRGPATALPDRPRRRVERREVGPPDRSVWEFDWDGDGTRRRDRVDAITRGSGWYQARGRAARPRRADRADRCTSRRGRSSGSRSHPTGARSR